MVTFNDIFIKFADLGGMELAVFVLIFTIIFALLQKLAMFGDKDKEGKKFNIIIALVISLIVIVPHILGLYPPGADVVLIILNSLPSIALIIIALLAVFLLIAMMGGGAPKWADSWPSGLIALIAFGVVAFIFARNAGWDYDLPDFLWFLDDPETQATLLVIAVFAIVIWFIVKNDEDSEGGIKKNAEAFLKGLGGMFKGEK